jgi:hypothetical protein
VTRKRTSVAAGPSSPPWDTTSILASQSRVAGRTSAGTVLDVFLEPLPPQPTPEQRKWSPPLWDRLSEGTIPAVLAVKELVHQSDDAVIMLDRLGV